MSDHHPKDQKVKARYALLVTSDSRTLDTDETGKLAKKILKDAGQKVVKYDIVANDADLINNWLLEVVGATDVEIIVTSGGTGIGSVDMTVDTARLLFEKEVPGFGEQFRKLSYQEVGVSGLLSRSTAGVVNKKLVFCLPGSKGAMRTALNKIIIPMAGHMLWELKRR